MECSCRELALWCWFRNHHHACEHVCKAFLTYRDYPQAECAECLPPDIHHSRASPAHAHASNTIPYQPPPAYAPPQMPPVSPPPPPPSQTEWIECARCLKWREISAESMRAITSREGWDESSAWYCHVSPLPSLPPARTSPPCYHPPSPAPFLPPPPPVPPPALTQRPSPPPGEHRPG